MEKKSVNILTRCLCIASVVATLFLCACPAFALGEGFGANRYAVIPFDYYVASGSGGPIDYLGTHSRLGTHLEADITGYDDRQWLADQYVTCDTNGITVLGSHTFIPASGATSTTSLAFYLEQDVAYLPSLGASSAENNGMTFEIATSGFYVTNIRVFGETYHITKDDQGQPKLISTAFEHTEAVSYTYGDKIGLSGLVKRAAASSSVAHQVGFKYLVVQFSIRRDNNLPDLDWKISANTYGVMTEATGLTNWLNNQFRANVFDKPNSPVKNELDVATFLGDSVSAFMDVEIFPGFTLGTLFGIALTIGVLFFGLKMLV